MHKPHFARGIGAFEAASRKTASFLSFDSFAPLLNSGERIIRNLQSPLSYALIRSHTLSTFIVHSPSLPSFCIFNEENNGGWK